jgi:hypothetical protein
MIIGIPEKTIVSGLKIAKQGQRRIAVNVAKPRRLHPNNLYNTQREHAVLVKVATGIKNNVVSIEYILHFELSMHKRSNKVY